MNHSVRDWGPLTFFAPIHRYTDCRVRIDTPIHKLHRSAQATSSARPGKSRLETKKEDDFYRWGLFHVPSWKPGTKPLLESHFTDLSHVGVKGNGEELIFGAEGEVLEVDGDVALKNCLWHGPEDVRHQLAWSLGIPPSEVRLIQKQHMEFRVCSRRLGHLSVASDVQAVLRHFEGGPKIWAFSFKDNPMARERRLQLQDHLQSPWLLGTALLVLSCCCCSLLRFCKGTGNWSRVWRAHPKARAGPRCAGNPSQFSSCDSPLIDAGSSAAFFAQKREMVEGVLCSSASRSAVVASGRPCGVLQGDQQVAPLLSLRLQDLLPKAQRQRRKYLLESEQESEETREEFEKAVAFWTSSRLTKQTQVAASALENEPPEYFISHVWQPPDQAASMHDYGQEKVHLLKQWAVRTKVLMPDDRSLRTPWFLLENEEEQQLAMTDPMNSWRTMRCWVDKACAHRGFGLAGAPPQEALRATKVALCNCEQLVAVISHPAYFRRLWCCVEWAFFLSRAAPNYRKLEILMPDALHQPAAWSELVHAAASFRVEDLRCTGDAFEHELQRELKLMAVDPEGFQGFMRATSLGLLTLHALLQQGEGCAAFGTAAFVEAAVEVIVWICAFAIGATEDFEFLDFLNNGVDYTSKEASKATCCGSAGLVPSQSRHPSATSFEVERNLSDPLYSSLSRSSIPTPHPRRDGDEQSSLEMQTMQAVEKTLCPVLYDVSAALAECDRPVVCARQQESTELCSGAKTEAAAPAQQMMQPMQPIPQMPHMQPLQTGPQMMPQMQMQMPMMPSGPIGMPYQHFAPQQLPPLPPPDVPWNQQAPTVVPKAPAAPKAAAPSMPAAHPMMVQQYVPMMPGATMPSCVPMPTMNSSSADPDQELMGLVHMMKNRQSELPADIQQRVQQITIKEGAKTTDQLLAAVTAHGEARDNYNAAVHARSQQHANWKKFLNDAVQLWQVYAAQFAEQEKKLSEQVACCKEIMVSAKLALESAKIDTGEVHEVSDEDIGDLEHSGASSAAKLTQTMAGLTSSLQNLYKETEAMVAEEAHTAKRPRTTSPRASDQPMSPPGGSGADFGVAG
eukprot:s148_g34.t1